MDKDHPGSWEVVLEEDNNFAVLQLKRAIAHPLAQCHIYFFHASLSHKAHLVIGTSCLIGRLSTCCWHFPIVQLCHKPQLLVDQ
jgi:hypothetical protein